MQSLPSLPASGPLRIVALGGTIALLAFFFSTLALLLRRGGPAGAARAGVVWAAATLGASLASLALARLTPALHPAASLATFVLAARNTLRFTGVPRILQAAGLVAWVVASAGARVLFGR